MPATRHGIVLSAHGPIRGDRLHDRHQELTELEIEIAIPIVEAAL